MIDSHVHLNRREFAGEIAGVLERAARSGVTGFLNVGFDVPSSEESVALARSDPRILAAVGIHPHDAAQLADERGRLTEGGREALTTLRELAADKEVVAIGEVGLDFYRDLSPRPAQEAALREQLRLADQVGLPVVFHVRDAWERFVPLVEECGLPAAGGVLHAFSGGRAEVEWARRNGFMLGIGGPVTYKGSTLPEMVRAAGLDLLLLETDAPWLPPVPFRGQRNEPGYLDRVRDEIAAILATEPTRVDEATSASFAALFSRRDQRS